MQNRVFGNVNFNMGWETAQKIYFDKKEYKIVVSADAYFESESITEEQEDSYADFLRNKEEIIALVEEKINSLGDKDRYKPSLMKINRNGDYAMIFDDVLDSEDGIVITLKPKVEVLSTDQYF